MTAEPKTIDTRVSVDDPKLAALEARLRDVGSLVVCFSGGVDSAFVLLAAKRVLGDRVVALTAVSPSLPPSERDGAIAVAKQIGARHVLVDTHEIDDPDYAKNGSDRCFYCKSELYTVARDWAAKQGISAIANGTNVDDLGDHRPGLDAARAAGILAPLVDVGMKKDDVRRLSHALGLGVWDKPAAACLSSRIPYGTSVTRERLSQIDGLEQALRGLGFRQLRVRWHETIARIELSIDELPRAVDPEVRAAMVAAGKQHGFAYVTLDLQGYRQGSHNELLAGKALRIMQG